MNSVWYRRGAAGGGLLGVLLLCAAAAQQNSAPSGQAAADSKALDPTAPGLSMVERLAALAAQADPFSNLYLNDRRATMRRSRLDQQPPSQRLREQAELARELLRAGRTQECLDEIASIRSATQQSQAPISERFTQFVSQLEGVAWLRLGEQQNCIQGHAAQSCIYPIEGSGIHRRQRGSRQAIEVFGKLLDSPQEDLGYQWLLNLAFMTLGEYPGSVPSQWLIAPELFRSDHELPHFHDIAAQVGLDHVSLAGGCVLDDLDGDGLIDVMVSSWGLTDQMQFFSNQGDGAFADRTAEAGLTGQVSGLNLVHADPDNDGDLDVLVLRGAWLGRFGRHPNSLLRNDGRGRFEDVTEQAGLLSFHPTQTAAWGDFDGDGWLDLFIGNESAPEPHPCELYHNQGDGTFRNVAGLAGVDHIGFVKAALWGDIDNDGDLDLFLSRIHQTNVLYRNDGALPESDGGSFGWRFTDISEQAGITEPLKSFPAWFFDYDNDGFLDLVVGTFGSFEGDSLAEVIAAELGRPSPAPRARLYRNRGDGSFEDVSRKTGMDRALLAMGANFGDLDNDGWLDAYFGTGEPNLATLVPNVMLRNDAGRRFQDVTTAGGFGHLQKGHGIAFGDVDNDGDQDILAVMGGAFSGDVYADSLFENPGNQNRWVTLRLQGVRSNRAAIGARVHLEVEQDDGAVQHFHHVVGSGGSFGSATLQLEAGLGRARRLARVEIRWPGSGTVEVHDDLPLERTVLLREGQAGFETIDSPRLRLGRSQKESTAAKRSQSVDCPKR